MEGLALLGIALLFTVIIGSILGILAFSEVRSLRTQVRELSARLHAGQGSVAAKAERPAAESSPPESPPPANEPEASADLWLEDDLARVADALDDMPETIVPETTVPAAATIPAGRQKSLFDRIQENWMVWLGGACVALAGIFLARYGIEQGLLGPKVRVAAGLMIALALYLAAEWMRRKTGGSSPVFAALAGGGAITAFAAVLSAVHLYQLFSPGFAFGLLAVVAVVTMWLARLHGPVLAAIGMLGAYAVPLLVSSGSGNLLGALVYSLIITVSVLLLLRYVYRPWLWLGMLAGALGWWLLSLTGNQVDGWRGPYLAVLAYLLYSVVPGDWLLRGAGSGSAAARAVEKFLLPGALVIVAAQCVSMLVAGFDSESVSSWSYLAPVLSGHALLTWGPLAVVLLLAARHRPSLAVVPMAIVPWALYLGQLAMWLLLRLDRAPDIVGQWQLTPWPVALQGAFLTYLAVTALLFSGMALWNLRRGLARYWWASLAVMAPLLALLVGYLLAADYLPVYLWCLLAAIFGAIFLFLGRFGYGRRWPKAAVVWLFVAGHFGYTLAVSLWLEQASLTLALAVQAISLAWVIRRFDVPALGWLLKGVLLLVVVRLTLNPWLLTYTADTHWSLWTYGGSALCAWIATRLLRQPAPGLARWAEAEAPVLGMEVEVVSRAAQGRHIATDLYHGGLYLPQHGGLHPALFHAGLLASAREAGAVVVDHCPVTAIAGAPGAWRIGYGRGETWASEVVYAGNGYTGGGAGPFPDIARRLVPIPSTIIATEPMGENRVGALFPGGNMIVETRATHGYFRPDPWGERILFGGRASLNVLPERESARRLRDMMLSVFPEL
ncbi:FAD-dependent oxidoreductase, partial [uncultured Microbulbifer sp.]|uniref:FAD-dependent oxidoreductase n=1 Tax=uncultured Microbulbifer sp. TaxID=348147 RepID=UPI0025E3FF0C